MKQILILGLICLVSACDSGTEWRDAPYAVLWIDLSSNRVLVYEFDDGGAIVRVGAEVVAVGSDKNYVVVKQKATEGQPLSYFYVDKAKDDKYLNGDDIAQGPFSEAQFMRLKTKLGLPEFSQNF